MTHLRTKLLVGGILLACSVAFLAYAGVKDGWVYYLPVDNFLADSQYHDQRVRLSGLVDENDLEVNSGQFHTRFFLLGESGRLRVDYEGVIPEMFQAGAAVVVEGRLGRDQTVFHADQVLTKCASKYEASASQPPGKQAGDDT